MSSVSLYTPPTGYYDAPFTWMYDATVLTDGKNALNQNIQVYTGFGDFIMRRVVGLDRVLNTNGGQITIYDSFRRALQAVPLDVSSTAMSEQAIIPEILYKENSSIYFDLWKVLRSITGGVSSAMLAFQGSRRKPGNGIQPSYQFRAKTLTYSVGPATAQIPAIQLKTVGGLNPLAQPPVSFYWLISDYDFDLYQIIISYSSAGGVVPTPAAAVNVFDSDSDVISNLPVPDIYINGAPGSTFKNGAIVPPLFFPIGSQLHVDLYSLINNAALLPVNVTVHFIGMRRYPCS